MHIRLNPEQKDTIKSMMMAGIPTIQIMKSLQQKQPGQIQSTSQDLYTFKKILNREQIQGKSSVEFIL